MPLMENNSLIKNMKQETIAVEENLGLQTAKAKSTTKALSQSVGSHVKKSPSNANIVESQKLANEGNEMFQCKKYHEALHLFTEAIKLDPREVRFYGNRAFCLEMLGEYEKALEDANVAVSMCPFWPKGYYRKGCAHEGMEDFEHSEKAFNQVLSFDSTCSEARVAVQRVMAKQLMKLGFPKEQCEAAVLHYSSVQEATNSLIKSRLNASSVLNEEFDSEDDEAMVTDYWSKSSTCSSSGRSSAHNIPNKSASPPIVEQQNVDPLLDPKNPLHWPTLWVGNLGQATTEKMITEFFTKYGKVRNMQMMLDKHCAFITYAEWKHAGEAMRDLQGREHYGLKMLIKYPDRALEGNVSAHCHKTATINLTQIREPMHSAHRGTVILRKTKK